MNIASITFAPPTAAPDAAGGPALLGAFGQVLDATLQPAAAQALPVGATAPILPAVAPDGQPAPLATGHDIPHPAVALMAAPEAAPAEPAPQPALPEPELAAAEPDAPAPVKLAEHRAVKPADHPAAEPMAADGAAPAALPSVPALAPKAEPAPIEVATPESAAKEPVALVRPDPIAEAQPEPAIAAMAVPATAPPAPSLRKSAPAPADAPAAIAAKPATAAAATPVRTDAAAASPESGPAFAAAVSAVADGADAVAPKADGLPSSLLSQSLPTHAARPAAAHPYPAQAQAPVVVNARPGQIGREMGVEIARKVSVGRDEMTIRLNPVEMGRIEVRMAFDDGGSLRAVVAAESPAALDMLRRDAADLTRALTDAGIRSDAQSFRFDSRSGGDGQGWQRQHQGGEQRSGDARAAATDAPEGDEPHYRPLRTSGQIDLMA